MSERVSQSGLVTKELIHAQSCARRSTHSIAITAMLDRLVIIIIIVVVVVIVVRYGVCC